MKGLTDIFWLFVASVVLCFVFDAVNPSDWPKWAIPAELAGVVLFFAMCKGLAMKEDKVREEKLQAEREARQEKLEMDKHLATLQHEKEERKGAPQA